MHPLQKGSLFTGLALSVLYAVGYGLAVYFAVESLKGLPTIAFLCLVPAAMGAVPLLFSDEQQARLYLSILFVPWMSIVALFVLLFAIGRETVICLLLLAAPFAAFVMLGALIGWIVAALIRRSKTKRGVAFTMMLFPLLFLPIERAFLVEEEQVGVQSSIVVRGTPSSIWEGLAQFETIAEGEYHPGLFHKMGFPRPIRATVDRVEVGGRRTGEFEGGLRLNEVITELDAPRRLAFSVDVDTATLLPHSTERHAFEGGYCRFVDAIYELEPIDDEHVRVTLSSRYVVKTSVNVYAKLWASAITADFQDRVLEVLKARAERRAASPRSPVAATRSGGE